MPRTPLRSKQVSERLIVLQALEIASTRLLGGWLPGIERWELKFVAAEHLWEDAQHSKELRTRLWELRVPQPDRKVPPGVNRIVEALSRAQVDFEFLAGLYLGLKTRMAAAYGELISSTYEVYDAPTIPVVRRVLADLERQLDWARDTLASLGDSGEKSRRIQRWLDYINAIIDSQGIFGAEIAGERDELPGYGMSLLPFSEARRDERFQICFTGMEKPPDDDRAANTVFQFVNYAHEMQAAETLGSVLWEAEGMEWEFYYDIARHCYDEARHSRLGETRLKELGHHIVDFPHCVANYAWRQLIAPLQRYCVLTYVIEADSFKYKHETYQIYLETNDLESAEAVLYDITDETMHVRLGKKWVPKLMEQSGYGEDLDTLVKECRALLMKHTVNPLQRQSAQEAMSV